MPTRTNAQAYLVSPKTCHRFVGYLEEEAVHTYTNILKEMETGQLQDFAKEPAPPIAKNYWRLKDDATMYDGAHAPRWWTIDAVAAPVGKPAVGPSSSFPAIVPGSTRSKLTPSRTCCSRYNVMEVVRADESNHRDVNHTLASIDEHDINPYTKV